VFKAGRDIDNGVIFALPAEGLLSTAQFNAWADFNGRPRAGTPAGDSLRAAADQIVTSARLPGTTVLRADFFRVPVPEGFHSMNANEFDITTAEGLKLYRLRQAYTPDRWGFLGARSPSRPASCRSLSRSTFDEQATSCHARWPLPCGRGGGLNARATRSPSVTLDWLDKTPPAAPYGVSFGVPWARGALSKGAAIALTAADGARVPVQSWPLVFWPDGSVKWSGHAIGAAAGVKGPLKLAIGTPGSPPAAIKAETTRRPSPSTPARWGAASRATAAASSRREHRRQESRRMDGSWRSATARVGLRRARPRRTLRACCAAALGSRPVGRS
jgi:hypothetical protein